MAKELSNMSKILSLKVEEVKGIAIAILSFPFLLQSTLPISQSAIGNVLRNRDGKEKKLLFSCGSSNGSGNG
jgi:hypothetical protein